MLLFCFEEGYCHFHIFPCSMSRSSLTAINATDKNTRLVNIGAHVEARVLQQMCELKVFTLILEKKISVDCDVIKATPLFSCVFIKIIKIKRNHQRANECIYYHKWTCFALQQLNLCCVHSNDPIEHISTLRRLFGLEVLTQVTILSPEKWVCSWSSMDFIALSHMAWLCAWLPCTNNIWPCWCAVDGILGDQ